VAVELAAVSVTVELLMLDTVVLVTVVAVGVAVLVSVVLIRVVVTVVAVRLVTEVVVGSWHWHPFAWPGAGSTPPKLEDVHSTLPLTANEAVHKSPYPNRTTPLQAHVVDKVHDGKVESPGASQAQRLYGASTAAQLYENCLLFPVQPSPVIRKLKRFSPDGHSTL
jgi:hypothetical protein